MAWSRRDAAGSDILLVTVKLKGVRHAARAVGHGMGISRTPDPVIRVSHIRKSYGATIAVSDVSFDVSEGEVFGLIGPNGAGKTTTMECVEGVRRPDAG